MMHNKSRRHSNNDFSLFINLMLADVLMSALLGIILLTITPQYDQGLLIKLAPYYFETQDTLKIPSSNILHLDINSSSQVLIDSLPHTLLSAEKTVESFIWKKFLTNRKCYLWIKVDRHASYDSYIQLRDLIIRAEKTLLDDLTLRWYGEPYSKDIPLLWRKKLSRKISICIIEEEELGKPYIEIKPFCDYYE